MLRKIGKGFAQFCDQGRTVQAKKSVNLFLNGQGGDQRAAWILIADLVEQLARRPLSGSRARVNPRLFTT